MANIKTITATTTESAVEFDVTYQFMWFRNFGESDCYICVHSGIVASADDVTLLKAGEVARLTLPQTPAQSKAYIKSASGSNTVEVHAQNYSDCPFKISGKGGESITIDPTPTQGSSNAVSSGGVYTALQNVGGFTRTVLYDSGGYDTYAPDNTDVNLLDNLSKYDMITVITGSPAANEALGGYTYLTNLFDVQMALASKGCYIQGYDKRTIGITFTNTTFRIIEHAATGESSNQIPQVYKIIGYKWG